MALRFSSSVSSSSLVNSSLVNSSLANSSLAKTTTWSKSSFTRADTSGSLVTTGMKAADHLVEGGLDRGQPLVEVARRGLHLGDRLLHLGQLDQALYPLAGAEPGELGDLSELVSVGHQLGECPATLTF